MKTTPTRYRGRSKFWGPKWRGRDLPPVRTRILRVARTYGLRTEDVMFVIGLVRQDASVMADPEQWKRRRAVVCRLAANGKQQTRLWRSCTILSADLDDIRQWIR